MSLPTPEQQKLAMAFLQKHEELLRREIVFMAEDVMNPPKLARNQSLAIHAPEALQQDPASRLAMFLLVVTHVAKGDVIDDAMLRDGLSIVGGLVNEAHQEEVVLQRMTKGGALEARYRVKHELNKDQPLTPDQQSAVDRVVKRRKAELKAVKEDMPELMQLQQDMIGLLKELGVQTTVWPRPGDASDRGAAHG